MTKLQISAAELKRLLKPIVNQKWLDSLEASEDALARITFSVITEPGDRFAGWLLAKHSAADVLAALNNNFNFKSLLSNEDMAELNQGFGNTEQLFFDAKQRWKPRLQFAAVTSALGTAQRLDSQILLEGDDYWPSGLAELGRAKPHALWLRGNSKVLKLADRSIAMVGSRLATSYGEYATTEIVTAAVDANLAVISGGAYGIDAIAHRATLAIEGFTVAVLAGGIDRLYPSGNHELLVQVSQQNVLVAEQPPGASPTKWRFLQRNRLIAALANATIVVEAGARSGALNTAHHAVELGRPVGALPGRFDSPQSAGCHQLIRSHSAELVDTASTAIRLALPDDQALAEFTSESLGTFETRAFDALSLMAKTTQQLMTISGLTNRELAIALGQLEALGAVERTERGWRKLTTG